MIEGAREERSKITTLFVDDAAATTSAVARPMPDAPPVINTVLPFSDFKSSGVTVYTEPMFKAKEETKTFGVASNAFELRGRCRFEELLKKRLGTWVWIQ